MDYEQLEPARSGSKTVGDRTPPTKGGGPCRADPRIVLTHWTQRLAE